MEINNNTKKLDPNTKIWRYMDLTKFLDLILNKSIYFRRVDKFEDPYEGYISSVYKEELRNQYDDIQSRFLISEKIKDQLHQSHLNGLELVPLYAYANCWFIGDVESAAMWKLYGQSNNCVAVCSTIDNLRLALTSSDNEEGRIYLEEVNYVNEPSTINVGNYLKPLFEKRLSFAHENEFRAVFLLDKIRAVLNSTINQPKKQDVNNKDGVNLSVDIKQLINSIYISPTADAHFHSIVEKIVDLAGFKGIECIQSELYKLK